MFAALATLPRDKSNTLLLLGACALVLAPHALRLPLWTTAFCAVLLAWRGWITFRGHRMPSKWLLLPIAAGALAAAWLTHRSLLGREPGVTLLALLMALKLLEMHARRDLFTVVFVAYFLVLANFFYDQTVFMAALMVATVGVLLVTQQSFQYTGRMPSLKRRLRAGGLVLLLAVPVTLVMFLLFPRIQGPLWRMPNETTAARAGLSDTMSPGNISDLAGSDDIAFRATFRDAPPPRDQLYWRGLVLGEFDGRTWRAQPRRFSRRGAAQIRVQWDAPAVVQQITLEPSGRPWLFALDLPASPPELRGMVAGFSAEVQMVASRPVTERLRYEVTSHPHYRLQADASDLDTAQWLGLPPTFNPRTRALAQTWRETARKDAALVDMALRHFREQPFRYTLQPPLLGVHTVDEFLFTTRAGFCEHYASAFVFLMRAAGIPARVVTGYLGGEINPVDGFFTVRQSDAHAWSEVWLPGEGWRRVDPTAAVAPERVEQSLATLMPRPAIGGLITLNLHPDSLAGRLRLQWEAFNNGWNQMVLNYGSDAQRALLQRLGFTEPDWTVLALLLGAAGSAALAVAALPLMWNRRRPDPVTALYDALCRDLARAGLPREAHEGPRAYAQRLAQQAERLGAARSRAVGEFLALVETLMYAPATAPARGAALARLKSLLNDAR